MRGEICDANRPSERAKRGGEHRNWGDSLPCGDVLSISSFHRATEQFAVCGYAASENHSFRVDVHNQVGKPSPEPRPDVVKRVNGERVP